MVCDGNYILCDATFLEVVALNNMGKVRKTIIAILSVCVVVLAVATWRAYHSYPRGEMEQIDVECSEGTGRCSPVYVEDMRGLDIPRWVKLIREWRGAFWAVVILPMAIIFVRYYGEPNDDPVLMTSTPEELLRNKKSLKNRKNLKPSSEKVSLRQHSRQRAELHAKALNSLADQPERLSEAQLELMAQQEGERTVQALNSLSGKETRAKIIEYADYSEEMPLTCPVCGWKGTPKSSGLIEYHDDVLDVTCPECDKMLLIVGYPLTQRY